MNRIFRAFLVVIGTLSVALGVLGILLPILPTTPFLLLAAYCYARSSDRFHQWLLSNRWFGTYIRNFQEGRGMSLRQKVVTIALLWLAVGFTVVFVLSAIWGRLIMLAIAAGVTTYLGRLRTSRARGEDL
jgi:uncharacterized protein